MKTLQEFQAVCLPCRAGLHEECSVALAGDLPEPAEGDSGQQGCCCNEEYTRREHIVAIWRARHGDGDGEPKKKGKKNVIFDADEATATELRRGNSGYIHSDAWPSERDIGTLADAASTGRKRVDEMYKITPGQVCDWARQANCGGGPKPVIGCMGNPASELHHGPDKNTLNNEKASRGVGTAENVHAICSECHNLWHGQNDKFYPAYERTAEQEKPWLPYTEDEWGMHSPREASFEELAAEEQRREEKRKTRGRDTRGRNSQPRTEPDTAVRAEE